MSSVKLDFWKFKYFIVRPKFINKVHHLKTLHPLILLLKFTDKKPSKLDNQHKSTGFSHLKSKKVSIFKLLISVMQKCKNTQSLKTTNMSIHI
jgi:hypothetical protein